MKNNLRTCVCFVVLLLFWGNLYPQYALTEDIYTVTDACDRSLKKDPAADYARISADVEGSITPFGGGFPYFKNGVEGKPYSRDWRWR